MMIIGSAITVQENGLLFPREEKKERKDGVMFLRI